MHTGKSYKLSEFLKWTRRDIYVLILLGVVPRRRDAKDKEINLPNFAPWRLGEKHPHPAL
jgi:hypothetical protein